MRTGGITADNRQNFSSRSGVALLTALGLLFVFSMLGVAYIGYSTSTLERAGYDGRVMRARHAALAGVNAAIGQLRTKVMAGKGAEMAGTLFTMDLPVYAHGGAGLSRRENVKTSAKVTISDESGKVNLNHVPAAILSNLLGLEDTAAFSTALANTATLGPFTSVNDLKTRGMIGENISIPRDALSVHNVASPEGYLNLNAATTSTLGVILGVTADVAAKANAARPFADMAAVAAASGKQPGDWAWSSSPQLSLASKAFRVVCEGTCFKTNAAAIPYDQSHRTIEAVMVFSEVGGDPVILYWKETSGASAQ